MGRDSSILESRALVLTIKTTKVSGDRVLERARLELTTALALGGKVLPEQRVVDVAYMRTYRHVKTRRIQPEMTLRTSAVELERRLKEDLLLRRGGFRKTFLGCVQAVHVGLVVLGVVQLHDLARDMRFKSFVGIGEVRERVLRARQH